MVIKIIKSRNILSIYITLIALCLILRAPEILHAQKIINDNSPILGELLYELIAFLSFSSWLTPLITTVLVLLQALQLNKLVIKHEALFNPSFLPALLYITCMSLLADFLQFTSVIVANSLLLVILDKLFELYKIEKPLKTIFDVGLCSAISALLYFPSIFTFPLCLISLNLLRTNSLREWIVCISGFALPYMFMLFYFFWTDQISLFYPNCLPVFFNENTNFISWNIKNAVPCITAIVLVVLAFIMLQPNFNKNTVQVRKYQQVLMLLLLLSGCSFLLQPQLMVTHFIIMVIPTSVFIAYYFLANKNFWITETLYILLVCTILHEHFG